MKKVTWDYAKSLDEDYAHILNTEASIHNHQLVLDDNARDSGRVLRWERDPLIDEMFHRGWFDLNAIMGGYCKTYAGITAKISPARIVKNDPLVRELYRRMGISLFGYWETFYWDINNPYAEEFKP